MIQRIQTLFWLVALILLAILLATPYATITHAGHDSPLRILSSPCALSTLNPPDWTLALAVPAPIITLLCLALNASAIPLYRKPKWQIRLSLWAIILQAILTPLLWFVPCAAANALQAPHTLHLIFVLPLIATAFSYLALRGVMKDQDFLRRMDRLR